jgi:hypothetical protein
LRLRVSFLNAIKIAIELCTNNLKIVAFQEPNTKLR